MPELFFASGSQACLDLVQPMGDAPTISARAVTDASHAGSPACADDGRLGLAASRWQAADAEGEADPRGAEGRAAPGFPPSLTAPNPLDERHVERREEPPTPASRSSPTPPSALGTRFSPPPAAHTQPGGPETPAVRRGPRWPSAEPWAPSSRAGSPAPGSAKADGPGAGGGGAAALAASRASSRSLASSLSRGSSAARLSSGSLAGPHPAGGGAGSPRAGSWHPPPPPGRSPSPGAAGVRGRAPRRRTPGAADEPPSARGGPRAPGAAPTRPPLIGPHAPYASYANVGAQTSQMAAPYSPFAPFQHAADAAGLGPIAADFYSGAFTLGGYHGGYFVPSPASALAGPAEPTPGPGLGADARPAATDGGGDGAPAPPREERGAGRREGGSASGDGSRDSSRGAEREEGRGRAGRRGRRGRREREAAAGGRGTGGREGSAPHREPHHANSDPLLSAGRGAGTAPGLSQAQSRGSLAWLGGDGAPQSRGASDPRLAGGEEEATSRSPAGPSPGAEGRDASRRGHGGVAGRSGSPSSRSRSRSEPLSPPRAGTPGGSLARAPPSPSPSRSSSASGFSDVEAASRNSSHVSLAWIGPRAWSTSSLASLGSHPSAGVGVARIVSHPNVAQACFPGHAVGQLTQAGSHASLRSVAAPGSVPPAVPPTVALAVRVADPAWPPEQPAPGGARDVPAPPHEGEGARADAALPAASDPARPPAAAPGVAAGFRARAASPPATVEEGSRAGLGRADPRAAADPSGGGLGGPTPPPRDARTSAGATPAEPADDERAPYLASAPVPAPAREGAAGDPTTSPRAFAGPSSPPPPCWASQGSSPNKPPKPPVYPALESGARLRGLGTVSDDLGDEELAPYLPAARSSSFSQAESFWRRDVRVGGARPAGLGPRPAREAAASLRPTAGPPPSDSRSTDGRLAPLVGGGSDAGSPKGAGGASAPGAAALGDPPRPLGTGACRPESRSAADLSDVRSRPPRPSGDAGALGGAPRPSAEAPPPAGSLSAGLARLFDLPRHLPAVRRDFDSLQELFTSPSSAASGVLTGHIHRDFESLHGHAAHPLGGGWHHAHGRGRGRGGAAAPAGVAAPPAGEAGPAAAAVAPDGAGGSLSSVGSLLGLLVAAPALPGAPPLSLAYASTNVDALGPFGAPDADADAAERSWRLAAASAAADPCIHDTFGAHMVATSDGLGRVRALHWRGASTGARAPGTPLARLPPAAPVARPGRPRQPAQGGIAPPGAIARAKQVLAAALHSREGWAGSGGAAGARWDGVGAPSDAATALGVADAPGSVSFHIQSSPSPGGPASADLTPAEAEALSDGGGALGPLLRLIRARADRERAETGVWGADGARPAAPRASASAASLGRGRGAAPPSSEPSPLRSALGTLGLLVTNAPNRAHADRLGATAALLSVLSGSSELGAREDAVLLLHNLAEAGEPTDAGRVCRLRVLPDWVPAEAAQVLETARTPSATRAALSLLLRSLESARRADDAGGARGPATAERTDAPGASDPAPADPTASDRSVPAPAVRAPADSPAAEDDAEDDAARAARASASLASVRRVALACARAASRDPSWFPGEAAGVGLARALGLALAHPQLPASAALEALRHLVQGLGSCSGSAHGTRLLTALSHAAGASRAARDALRELDARRALADLGRGSKSSRVRARALSLLKVIGSADRGGAGDALAGPRSAARARPEPDGGSPPAPRASSHGADPAPPPRESPRDLRADLAGDLNGFAREGAALPSPSEQQRQWARAASFDEPTRPRESALEVGPPAYLSATVLPRYPGGASPTPGT